MGRVAGKKYPICSEEEKKWGHETFNRLMAAGLPISHVTVRSEKLIEEYKRLFGKEKKVSNMYQWLRVTIGKLNKNAQSKPKKGSDAIKQLLAPTTNYMLIVNGVPFNFDSVESVKQALEDPKFTQFIGDMKLFVATPINVQRKITVSIGQDAKAV